MFIWSGGSRHPRLVSNDDIRRRNAVENWAQAGMAPMTNAHHRLKACLTSRRICRCEKPVPRNLVAELVKFKQEERVQFEGSSSQAPRKDKTVISRLWCASALALAPPSDKFSKIGRQRQPRLKVRGARTRSRFPHRIKAAFGSETNCTGFIRHEAKTTSASSCLSRTSADFANHKRCRSRRFPGRAALAPAKARSGRGTIRRARFAG